MNTLELRWYLFSLRVKCSIFQ